MSNKSQNYFNVFVYVLGLIFFRKTCSKKCQVFSDYILIFLERSKKLPKPKLFSIDNPFFVFLRLCWCNFSSNWTFFYGSCHNFQVRQPKHVLFYSQKKKVYHNFCIVAFCSVWEIINPKRRVLVDVLHIIIQVRKKDAFLLYGKGFFFFNACWKPSDKKFHVKLTLCFFNIKKKKQQRFLLEAVHLVFASIAKPPSVKKNKNGK